MSYATELEIRNLLIGFSTLTALVSSSNIKIGWSSTLDSFPAVTISQAAGTDTGQLGYGTSPSGSRVGVEEVSYQLDIYSRTSWKETLDIEDAIKKVLLKNGYSKTSSNDMWEPDIKAFRKITMWRKVSYHND